MKDNYWDKLMETKEQAGSYMMTYGEGPGCETRNIISSFINEGETVLDVGCGPGWNYDHFLENGPRIYRYKGVDYSHLMIEACKDRWPGAQFEVQDCRSLKEPDYSWDVVILQDVLEHTNGYEKPIQEALRVAKKRIIITFWRGFAGVDKVNDDGDDGYGADYNKENFEKYLDSLEYFWVETETSPKANRWHSFYIIDLLEDNSTVKKEDYN